MARIRTIKPEFPHSESMGRVSRDARLLFIMLWTIVDDSGTARGNSRMLASLLFPYDDDAGKLMDKWLVELESTDCVVRYIVDGQTYIQICNWLNHQKIDKPTPSKLPQFANCREDSRILPVGREGNGMEGKGEEGRGVVAVAPKASTKKSDIQLLVDMGVDEQVANDWLLVRKAKRAPLTKTVMDDLVRESAKAGISVGEAVWICARKNWQGFNSTWNWNDVKTEATSYASAKSVRLDTINQIFGGSNGTNRQIIDITPTIQGEGDGACISETFIGIR